MAFFGGDSSSSSSTLVQNQQQDRRIATENGLAISGNDVTIGGSDFTLQSGARTGNIMVTDGGAVAAALEFAQASDQATSQTLADVLGFADDAFARANERVAGAQGETMQKYAVVGVALIAAAIVAMRIWGKA